jgi:SAM-dependent methyltransferase
MGEGVSAWRQALSEHWDEMRAKTDWMGIPEMHDHVSIVHTGAPLSVAGDWIDHSRERHLLPLAGRLGRDLSLVSFGCGTGSIEREFLSRGWPVRRVVCREYDHDLLDRAKANITSLCAEQVFQRFDFNNPEAVGDETFDVAFFCHSMHHCTDIEKFLPFLNRIVAPDGMILGLDYFGPSRLQASYNVKGLLDEIFASFPERLRVNLLTGETEQDFRVATMEEVARGDPTEAPRSADLRSMLFSNFPVFELSPMGGTLLRHLLANRAGNFRTGEDRCILKLLMILERELIRSGRLQSDNLYFALGKSDRV